MRANLLMNCLWYEDLSPEQLADTLELDLKELFDKLLGDKEFTPEEINKTATLLGLTEAETTLIFGNE